MTESIHLILESLPESSLTTRVLDALDFVVPGEWKNITRFDALVQSVTGDTDEGLTQQVGEKAIALWFDESLGYQRGLQIFRWVDDEATAAGAASLAALAGRAFEPLRFLSDLAPKPDTTQAIDAAVKFAAEMTSFCLTNGFPGDGVSDFAGALGSYGKEEKMRIAAWLALDCVLPLGPDFLQKMIDAAQSISEGELANHRIFRFVADHLPGDFAHKKDVLWENIAQSAGTLQSFAGGSLSQSDLLDRVRGYVDVTDDRLDLLSAALDLSTNYFEHTGIQSVARRLVTRAYAEI